VHRSSFLESVAAALAAYPEDGRGPGLIHRKAAQPASAFRPCRTVDAHGWHAVEMTLRVFGRGKSHKCNRRLVSVRSLTIR
jgi:hypothetical protein